MAEHEDFSANNYEMPTIFNSAELSMKKVL